jgi:hypothetical protein
MDGLLARLLGVSGMIIDSDKMYLWIIPENSLLSQAPVSCVLFNPQSRK